MTPVSIHDTLGQLVAERPGRSRVFERHGLDYCCGGKKTLRVACEEQHLNPKELLEELQQNDRAVAAPETDWQTAPLSVLADHIVATHHAYLREALPRLSFLTKKVRDAHGRHHPELIEVAAIFAAFRAELEHHAAKEEQILFPFIKQLELPGSRPAFHCGSVNNPIHVMEAEHEDAGRDLARMRALTQGFTPPHDACNTYRAMLDALAELEADMHVHVHKENSILFPRASALEADRVEALTQTLRNRDRQEQ